MEAAPRFQEDLTVAKYRVNSCVVAIIIAAVLFGLFVYAVIGAVLKVWRGYNQRQIDTITDVEESVGAKLWNRVQGANLAERARKLSSY